MRLHRMITAMGAALVLSACGGDDGGFVVVDEQKTLSEGTQLAYPLISGTYEATITASNNGVLVSWLGGSGCTTSVETKSYASTCTIGSAGQLVIFNPTLLGVGGDEIVQIRLVRN